MNTRILGGPVFHDFDDPYTDPVLVQLMILLGKSPFWNVQLALGEFDNFSGRNGNPSYASSIGPEVGLEQVYEVILGDDCPTLHQYVWAMQGKTPVPVKAAKLPYMIGQRLWQPLTGKSNKILSAEIKHDVKLYKSATESNISATTSRTHKVIRDFSDPIGFPLCHHRVGSDICSWKGEAMVEKLVRKQQAGTGAVVKLHLDGDQIYLVGDSPAGGLVSHNNKQFGGGEGDDFPIIRPPEF